MNQLKPTLIGMKVCDSMNIMCSGFNSARTSSGGGFTGAKSGISRPSESSSPVTTTQLNVQLNVHSCRASLRVGQSTYDSEGNNTCAQRSESELAEAPLRVHFARSRVDQLQRSQTVMATQGVQVLACRGMIGIRRIGCLLVSDCWQAMPDSVEQTDVERAVLIRGTQFRHF